MSDVEQIEALDGCMTPSEPTQFDRQTATLLREMYESWARDADAVLDRTARLRRLSRQVAGANELRDAAGRVRAMLQVTLDVDGGGVGSTLQRVGSTGPPSSRAAERDR